MIELYERGVLQHIAPPKIRAIRRMAIKRVEELFFRGRQTEAHIREFVVDEPGIKTGDEAAGHRSREDQGEERGDCDTEQAEGGVSEGLEVREGGRWGREEAVFAEDGEAREEHRDVDCEGCA